MRHRGGCYCVGYVYQVSKALKLERDDKLPGVEGRVAQLAVGGHLLRRAARTGVQCSCACRRRCSVARERGVRA